MLDKLAKILAQAENAATKEEAETYMQKAQLLSSKYSIELAQVRSQIEKSQRRESPTTKQVVVADSKSKTKKHMVNLYLAIAAVNDLVTNIAHNSTYVVPHGFPTDIDVTEALFFSLSRQMVEQANEWLATGEYKKETTRRWSDREFGYVDKPIDGRVARASFYSAFIYEVSRRLRAAKEQALVEYEEETGTTGTELVLLDKSREVGDYYRSVSKAKGSWGGPSQGSYSNSASAAGNEAGKSARLTGTKSVGGGRQAIGA